MKVPDLVLFHVVVYLNGLKLFDCSNCHDVETRANDNFAVWPIRPVMKPSTVPSIYHTGPWTSASPYCLHVWGHCRLSVFSQSEVLVTKQVAYSTSRLLWHVPPENMPYLTHTWSTVRCWFTLKCQQVYEAEHNHHNPTVPPTICCYTEGEIWHLRECSVSKGNDSAVPLIVCFSMQRVSY